ncbi:MAG: hypothetical protein EA407_09960 [Rhodobacteraceae bacterium]|nr:MAG: hypothetical protein EA407_09960 [Paracoccaceae bacterium]
MATTKSRSFFVTLFGVVGTLWFALHAIEYVLARYAPLGEMVPLPDPLGLEAFYAGLPVWLSVALTATIWLGLLGAFLLLLGDKASVLILSLAVITALVALILSGMAFFSGLGAIGSVDPVFFVGAQAAFVIGIWLYARTAKRYGTL